MSNLKRLSAGECFRAVKEEKALRTACVKRGLDPKRAVPFIRGAGMAPQDLDGSDDTSQVENTVADLGKQSPRCAVAQVARTLSV